MRAAVLALLLIVPRIARADDTFDKAVRDLSADDAAVRDAAERTLLAGGEAFLEPCRRAATAAADPEVRQRLSRICGLLETEVRLKGLADLWKDRWYKLTPDPAAKGDAEDPPLPGAPVKKDPPRNGWVHFTATPAKDGDRKAWKILLESEIPEIGKRTLISRFEGTVLNDAALTPVEILESEAVREGQGAAKGGTMKLTLKDGMCRVELLKSDEHVPEADRVHEIPLKTEDNVPFGLSRLVPMMVERASLSRTKDLRVALFPIYDEDVFFAFGVRFCEETTLTFGGEVLPVRRYEFDNPESPGDPSSFLVSDSKGLVKYTGGGWIWTLSDKAGALPPEKPAPDATKLRAAHDVLTAAIGKHEWKAMRGLLGEPRFGDLRKWSIGSREAVLQRGGATLDGYLRRLGTDEAGLKAMGDEELVARNYFDEYATGKTVEIVWIGLERDGDGRVEFVESGVRLTYYSYEWDGQAWQFRSVGSFSSSSGEPSTPEDVLKAWKDQVLNVNRWNLWGLVAEESVCGWILATSKEFTAAREAGDGELRKLAEKYKARFEDLREMDARDFAELAFWAEADRLTAEEREAYANLEWDEARIDGNSAVCRCTRGAGSGTDWRLVKAHPDSWQVITDPLLERFRRRHK